MTNERSAPLLGSAPGVFVERLWGAATDTILQLLSEAAALNADRVHILPDRDSGSIRVSAGGDVLGAVENIPQDALLELTRALARLAHLPAHRVAREPLSGALNPGVGDEERAQDAGRWAVSLQPAVGGALAVLRSMRGEPTDLAELGFDSLEQETLREAVGLEHGLIVVTGPTGSGKSKSLDALTGAAAASGASVVVEIVDPIEFLRPGRIQIELSDRFNYRDSVRNSMLADADVITTDRCRTAEDWGVTVEAALAGTLVFAGMHAGEVASALDRLRVFVKPHLLTDVLRVVVAQRLVRRLCDACKVVDEGATAAAGATVYRAAKCPRCNQSGYRGRALVSEVLPVTRLVTQRIAAGERGQRIVELAEDEKIMRRFEQRGGDLLKQGVTSVAEWRGRFRYPFEGLGGSDPS